MALVTRHHSHGSLAALEAGWARGGRRQTEPVEGRACAAGAPQSRMRRAAECGRTCRSPPHPNPRFSTLRRNNI